MSNNINHENRIVRSFLGAMIIAAILLVTVMMAIHYIYDVVYIKPEKEITDLISVDAGTSLYLASPQWKDDMIIGRDIHMNKEYRPKDLEGRKIVFAYPDEDREIFFKGGFDRELRWDGACILNVYSGRSLSIALKSVFDGGVQTDEKRLIVDDGRVRYLDMKGMLRGDQADVWEYAIKQPVWEISLEDPDVKKIVAPESFINMSRGYCMSHYHGYVKHGFYEDDTGDAYLVRFFEDGNVHSLYRGGFRDGKYEDNTGEAGYLIRDRGDASTMYIGYVGSFEKGMPDLQRRNSFINPVTMAQAERIVNDRRLYDTLVFDEECFNRES